MRSLCWSYHLLSNDHYNSWLITRWLYRRHTALTNRCHFREHSHAARRSCIWASRSWQQRSPRRPEFRLDLAQAPGHSLISPTMVAAVNYRHVPIDRFLLGASPFLDRWWRGACLDCWTREVSTGRTESCKRKCTERRSFCSHQLTYNNAIPAPIPPK